MDSDEEKPCTGLFFALKAYFGFQRNGTGKREAFALYLKKSRFAACLGKGYDVSDKLGLDREGP